MDEDLCQDAILDRQQLKEEMALKEQELQEREDNQSRSEAFEQDYKRQFGCLPEAWVYEEMYQEDIKSGLVDSPVEPLWDGLY